MMTQQRRQILACAAGAAILLMSVALIFTSRRPGRAARLADTRSWNSDAARLVNNNDPAPYFWLSDHEILFFRGNDPLNAFRYDTRTATETRVALAAPPGLSPPKGFALTVSPDKQWLLWMSERGANRKTVASRITGKPDAVTWPNSWEDANLAWLPDSSGWMAWTGQKVVYRLRNARIFYAAPPPTAASGLRSYPYLLGPAVSIDRTSLFFAPCGVGRADFQFTPLPRMVPLTVAGRVVPVAMPPGGAWRNVLVVSPRNDKVAWLTFANRPPPVAAAWLDRLIPGLRLSERFAQRTATFWTGDLARGAAGKIYTLPLRLNDKDPSPPSWTPDGKQLSFIHNGALWTLPAQ